MNESKVTRRVAAIVVLTVLTLGVLAGAGRRANAQTVITFPDGTPVTMPDGSVLTVPEGMVQISGYEHVDAIDTAIEIRDDGVLDVTETIAYDFGETDRHGIFRNIPVRYYYDDRYDRIYDVAVQSVSSETAPDQYEVLDEGNDKVIKIGDPDRTVRGTHTYVIHYTVRGALNRQGDTDELFWNAIGPQWQVPIERAGATVVAPGAVSQVRCFAGPAGVTTPCDQATFDGDTAAFTAEGLAPYSAFTVVVAFPAGIVPPPEPILDERWSFQRAFSLDPERLAVAGALLAGVALVVGLVLRRGRDRRYVGQGVDVAYGNVTGTEQAVGLFESGVGTVEFVPPDGIKPGQVGTLIDEVAHPVDVVATIVDLAVHGYLRIEELEATGILFKKPDWRLTRTDKDASSLIDYEAALLSGLFDTGSSVVLSELNNTFASKMLRAQSSLYDQMVTNGWFAVRPDRTRSAWRAIGLLAVFVSIGVLVLLAWLTHWAIVGVPLVVGAFVLFVGAKRMPSRTARGTAMTRRVMGFRELFTDPEKERQRWREHQNLFSQYLPYAIVFGMTEKWAKAFEGLDGEPVDTTSWYSGNQAFSYAYFGSAMQSFTTTTSGTLSSTPAASGSSGFSGGGSSGGGGGGGGGGSW